MLDVMLQSVPALQFVVDLVYLWSPGPWSWCTIHLCSSFIFMRSGELSRLFLKWHGRSRVLPMTYSSFLLWHWQLLKHL